MAITVQQGTSVTIKLKFMNADNSVAKAPTSGGSVSVSGIPGLSTMGSAVLAADQQTVTYTATGLGTDTITYSGPQGLHATETTNNVATTATSVMFDETTFALLP